MISTRMVLIPVIVGLMILIIACGPGLAASPQLPCEFYGSVSISGNPAPVGTVITALINKVQQGSITVKEPGRYGGLGTFDERLIVMAGEQDLAAGTPVITFKIGETVADQTAPYSPGTSAELGLSKGSVSTTSTGSAQTFMPVQTVFTPVPIQSVQPVQVLATMAPVLQAGTPFTVPTQAGVQSEPVIMMSVTPVPNLSAIPAAVNQTVRISDNQSTSVTPTPVLTPVQSAPVNSTGVVPQNGNMGNGGQAENKTVTTSSVIPSVVVTPVPVVTNVQVTPSTSVNGTLNITPGGNSTGIASTQYGATANTTPTALPVVTLTPVPVPTSIPVVGTTVNTSGNQSSVNQTLVNMSAANRTISIPIPVTTPIQATQTAGNGTITVSFPSGVVISGQ
ncbi:MAG TPA: hypothetical protein VN372_03450 [Methanospirillum sp.]|nr:hypothetical protein [Methanospirillum sp.]